MITATLFIAYVLVHLVAVSFCLAARRGERGLRDWEGMAQCPSCSRHTLQARQAGPEMLLRCLPCGYAGNVGMTIAARRFCRPTLVEALTKACQSAIALQKRIEEAEQAIDETRGE